MSKINTNAFYKMSLLRAEVETKINKYNIEEMREKARALPKKSQERKDLNEAINKVINSEEFKLLKTELNTINRCFNIAFYL